MGGVAICSYGLMFCGSCCCGCFSRGSRCKGCCCRGLLPADLAIRHPQSLHLHLHLSSIFPPTLSYTTTPIRNPSISDETPPPPHRAGSATKSCLPIGMLIFHRPYYTPPPPPQNPSISHLTPPPHRAGSATKSCHPMGMFAYPFVNFSPLPTPSISHKTRTDLTIHHHPQSLHL